MKHDYGAHYEDIRLRPLEKRDIGKLREWRNDSENSKFLRQIGKITPQMQEKWYDEYLKDTDQIIFAIEETKVLRRMIGSIALYNFRGDVAEIGKIQIGDTQAHGRGLGRKSLVVAAWIGFSRLGLKKLTGSVHRDNVAAHKNDMQAGFVIVGQHEAPMGGTEDELELDKERLCMANEYVKEIVLD